MEKILSSKNAKIIEENEIILFSVPFENAFPKDDKGNDVRHILPYINEIELLENITFESSRMVKFAIKRRLSNEQ